MQFRRESSLVLARPNIYRSLCVRESRASAYITSLRLCGFSTIKLSIPFTQSLATAFPPFNKGHRLTTPKPILAEPAIDTNYGCSSALQRRILPLALPSISTRSHHILAGIPWLHLRDGMEVVEGTCQVRHPIYHRNFLSVSCKHD